METFKKAASVLMVSPEYFEVVEPINAHMQTDGELNKINSQKAKEQWNQLKDIYKELAKKVYVLPGVDGLPDMTFAANQSFPFWRESEAAPQVLLSNMRHRIRQPEVAHFAHWYKEQGYEPLFLEPDLNIEGHGDLLWHPNMKYIFAGFGFRTKKEAITEVKKRFDLPLVPLELCDDNFYHLDTCLCPLNQKTALVYSPALSRESRQILDQHFETLFEIPEAEAYNFAGNAHSPDNQHVIMQDNNPVTSHWLTEQGFQPVPVDTKEFIKSGGSVFCLKTMVF